MRQVADITFFRHSAWVPATLTFRYDFSGDPNDDFGWLIVDVVGGGFSGQGGFWVQWQDVTEFGESLSAYPVQRETPISAQWGFDKQEGEDLRLKVVIAPANATGDLIVTVEVADYLNPRQRVQTSFLTNYPDLEAFRSAIGNLMSRNADRATLLGR